MAREVAIELEELVMKDRHAERCPEITESGRPCRQYGNGSRFCVLHDPGIEAAEKRRELARAGGVASGRVRKAKAERARALEPVTIDGPEDAVALVVETVNDIRMGRIDPPRARIVLTAAEVLLRHSSTRELANRMEAMEAKLKEHGLDDPVVCKDLYEAIREMRRRGWRTGE